MDDSLLNRFSSVRQRSLAIASPLSEEDCCVQSMPDASPVKWHLAHTTWFFETFILEPFQRRYQSFHPSFRILFNSYYNGVGEKHPRAQRGLLTRPSHGEVLAYRSHVDECMHRLLRDVGQNEKLVSLLVLGLQHEQQHQELMLTDLKHLLSLNPLQPAYRERRLSHRHETSPCTWLAFDSGVVDIGHVGNADNNFCFDNELPRHRQFLEPFSLASRLVTNGEYLAFIEAGGYRNPALWLSEGWDWIQAQRITQPGYWRHDESGWTEFTLYGPQNLDLHGPVIHLSYFEADAYARWCDARLPTEAEWEYAAAGASDLDRDQESLHPDIDVTSSHACSQLFGNAWQWTLSSYAPYPGYRAEAGAIGEYNGKFMSNQYVLRGSSCVTPVAHSRTTYRNFFPASARWQFTGVRLARSL